MCRQEGGRQPSRRTQTSSLSPGPTGPRLAEVEQTEAEGRRSKALPALPAVPQSKGTELAESPRGNDAPRVRGCPLSVQQTPV